MKAIARTFQKEPLLLSLLTVAVVITLWSFITYLDVIQPIFLPSPAATASALWKFLADGRFFRALLFSLGRIATATVLAACIGSIVGILMGSSRTMDRLLSPITQPLRYLPITALIPLLVLWFGIGEVMRITFLFLGIVFYFIPLVRNAIQSVPQNYIDVAKAFGARTFTIVRKVYVPHALPQIFDGLIIVNGIGWTYVILAEIINAKDGLGYLINIAGRLQRSDEVFAGLILVAAVALTSDQILQWVRSRYFFW